MYDERFVTPMRQELTQLGVEEMRTAQEVDAKLKDAQGTTLVVVNSVCGCAARNAATRADHVGRRRGVTSPRNARSASPTSARIPNVGVLILPSSLASTST